MLAFPFDVVVFDLDGTLVDSAPDLTGSLNHTLGTIGRQPLPAEAVRRMIGNGVRMLLRCGLAATGSASDEEVEAAYPAFMAHYGAHLCDATTAYPGVGAILKQLAGRGISLALCTNKPESLARSLIKAFGWADLFRSIVGGDTLAVRKPDPTTLMAAIDRAGGGRAVLVGDSIIDADTARRAGIPFVAVAFGYSDRPVAALGSAVIIDRFEALPAALERLGAGL